MTSERSGLPPVPTGIQQLLRLASVDAAFRAELLDQRAAVAALADVRLTASERAVLAAVSEQQLRSMIEGMPPPPVARREFLRAAAASAVVALGGAALVGAVGPGCDAEDIPRPFRREMETEGGIAPHEPPPPLPPKPEPLPPRPENYPAPPAGIAPDLPPPRPEEVEPRTAGIAPDLPPPRPEVNPAQTLGGIAPDLPPPRIGTNPTHSRGGHRSDLPPRD